MPEDRGGISFQELSRSRSPSPGPPAMPDYPGAPERDASVSEFSRDMLERLEGISAPYEPYTSGDTTDDEGEELLPAVDPEYVTTPPPRKAKTLMEDAAEEKGSNAITAVIVGVAFIMLSSYL